MNTLFAVLAGAFYSASYVCPKEYVPLALLCSGVLVIALRSF